MKTDVDNIDLSKMMTAQDVMEMLNVPHRTVYGKMYRGEIDSIYHLGTERRLFYRDQIEGIFNRFVNSSDSELLWKDGEEGVVDWDNLLRPKAAARIIGIHHKTVAALRRRGFLHGFRHEVKGCHLYLKTEVKKFVEIIKWIREYKLARK